MFTKRNYVASLLIAFNVYTSFAQTTEGPPFGKGIFNIVGKDSTWSMKIGARMQFLTMSTWVHENGHFADPDVSASIRRARLKFDGFAYSPKLKYKIELGLSNRDISGASEYTSNAPRYILDAVVMWNFYQNFELWVGQAKLPGNLETTISSGNLQQVGRSLLNSNFTLDRETGLQLRHHFSIGNHFLVREKLALSQGEGRNVTGPNLGGAQFTGRIELLPFGEFTNKGDFSGSDQEREKTPKLMFSATYDHNKDTVKTRSNQGSYMVNDMGFHHTDINTFFLDAMFKYNGFSFMGEYAHRSADDPLAKNSDGSLTGDRVLTGSGLNLQTGYLFRTNWELSGRYTQINPKSISGQNLEREYTLGLSKYILGHQLKVQTDFSYLTLGEDNEELMFRLQFDIHF